MGSHAREARRFLRSGRDVRVERYDGNRVWRACDLPPDALRALLAPYEPPPDAVLRSRPGSRVYHRELDGRPLCVKELARGSAPRRLAARWLGDGNRTAWQAAWRLRELGIGTPRPLCLIECRSGPLALRSLFVTQYLAAATPLGDYLRGPGRALAPARRFALSRALAATLRELHERGPYHRDWAVKNLLVEETATGFEISLVDLESVRLHRHPDLERRKRNLIQLSGMYPDPLGFIARQRFLRDYTGGEGPLYTPEALRELRERALRKREYSRRNYLRDHGPGSGALEGGASSA